MAIGYRTVIEISSRFIKAVRSRSGSGRGLILWSEVCPINNLTDEAVSSVIRKWRAMRRIALPGDHVILLIERRHAFFKLIDLPSHDPDELKRMVALQAAGYTPYTREELVIDHLVQEKMSSGYSRVLMVMVPCVVVERYRHLCSTAGVVPDQITVSVFGLVCWGILAGGRDGFVVVDADSGMIQICFVRSETLVFSRQVLLDENLVGEDRAAQMAREYILTNKAWVKEGPSDSAIRNVYFSFPGMDPAVLTGSEGRSDMVFHVSPLQDMIVIPARLSWPEQVLSGGVSLAAVCGAALSQVRIPGNLVSTDQRVQAMRKVSRRMLWRALLIGFFGVLSLAGVMSIPWFSHSRQMERLNLKLVRLGPELERVRGKIRQVQSLEKLLYVGTRIPAALREIWNLVGNDIVLTVLDFSKTGDIAMEGYSPANESVNLFNERLRLSPLLGDVRIEFINKRFLEIGEVDYFRISCRIKESM